MKFYKGDTVKTLLLGKYRGEKGFIVAVSKDKFITVNFCNTKFISKLFNNYELALTRIVLIEKNII